MIIVRFNEWQEFVVEAKESPPEDQTVRLTFNLRHDGHGAPHLSMIAGYHARNSLVEFVQYLGLQPRDPASPRGREVQALFDERRRALEGLGVRVKPGRYHAPQTPQR